jgi:hypothetical protein
MLKFNEFLNESKHDFVVYHNSYSSAVSSALDYIEKTGYTVESDDVWNKISMGPKKPKDGDTNKFSIGLRKEGREVKKMAHIQIYGMGTKYELNIYIN